MTTDTIKARDAAVEDFVSRLQTTMADDLLGLSRRVGMIPTNEMRAQADMLAATATEAVMRNIRFISVKTGERTADVEQYRAVCAETGTGNFEADKLAPQQAESLAKAIMENNLPLVIPSVEGDLSIWTAVLMVIPAKLHEAAAPPPAVKPRSPIIMPGE